VSFVRFCAVVSKGLDNIPRSVRDIIPVGCLSPFESRKTVFLPILDTIGNKS
jgi:hypothetical protein